MLADFAQVHAGKLFVAGGGVQVAMLPIRLGVAGEIVVPWEYRSRRQQFRLDLVDADGRAVTLPSPIANAAPAPFQAVGQFEVVPPPGTPAGSELTFAFAFNVAGLPLDSGSSYKFRLFIAEEATPEATATFATQALS